MIPRHQWHSKTDEEPIVMVIDNEERNKRENKGQKEKKKHRPIVEREPTKENGLILSEKDRMRLRNLNLHYLDLGAFK
jgi:hypothetical protein